MPGKRGAVTGQCATCSHPERYRVELLLAGGASIRAVSSKYGINYHSVRRHWIGHVSAERKAALMAGPVKFSDIQDRAAEEELSVIDHLKALRGGLYRTLDAAIDAGDRNGVATLSGRIIEVLRELGRASGELAKLGGASVNVQNNFFASPAFATVQAEFIGVLVKLNVPRVAAINALREVEARLAGGGGAPAIAPPPMVIEHAPAE